MPKAFRLNLSPLIASLWRSPTRGSASCGWCWRALVQRPLISNACFNSFANRKDFSSLLGISPRPLDEYLILTLSHSLRGFEPHKLKLIQGCGGFIPKQVQDPRCEDCDTFQRRRRRGQSQARSRKCARSCQCQPCQCP